MGLVLLGVVSGAAMADLPDDRVAEYFIRETPSNPQSNIILVAELELTAISQDGDDITWEITSITLTEPGTGEAEDTVWADDAPDPVTSNGYWIVTHDDPTDPQDTEFDQPPLLSGTATADDPADDDLDYDLSGGECDSSCQQLFSGSVGGMIYTFQRVSAEDPIAEGDDDPVEIDGEILVP